jgi:vacuolar-type H+-ATPase subunit E/Vma4
MVMITIEEKLNLFTRIVYDKVEKQNADAISRFNQECGSLIQQKTEEFTKQAELIESQIEKETEKEKLQMLSKAKIEGKKQIVAKKDEIFNDAIKSVLECARDFTETKQYEEMLIQDIKSALIEMSGSTSMVLYLTVKDSDRYDDKIKDIFKGRALKIACDDSLVGGFVLIDTDKNIKIDMSYTDRVNSSKDLIGERLFAILQ